MRLATSVGLFFKDPAGRTIQTPESVLRCAAAGFKVLDMNFSPMLFEKTEFIGDDWEKQAYILRETAEKAGAEFSQAHLPCHADYKWSNSKGDPEYTARFIEYTRRCAIISGILGVKWAVGHSYLHFDEDIYDTDADLAYNLELYKPILEELKRNGVGLAFENIASMKPPLKRRYTGIVEELCELVDAFHDEAVGACWDFGQGNRMYADQARALRVLGQRLRATHLNDNPSHTDSHTLPFVGGNIKWETCLPVLSEIGYSGDLTYELKFASGLPDCLKDSFARLAYEVGNYCLKIAKGGPL